jgi:hypothetical protein
MKQIFSEIINRLEQFYVFSIESQVQILKSLRQNSFSILTVSDIYVLLTTLFSKFFNNYITITLAEQFD